MARLIVSVVGAELTTIATANEASLFVSVSRSTNGQPVIGLTAENFRATLVGLETEVGSSEVKWQQPKVEGSGFYSLGVSFTDKTNKFIVGEQYYVGVQVRKFKGKKAIDYGQAVGEFKKFLVV